MNRRELYAKVTELSLQEAIKAKFGRNFTQVGNADLEAMIKTAEGMKAVKSLSKKDLAPKKKVTEDKPKMSGTVESKFAKMVEILGKKRILLPSEVDAIANA